METSMMLTEDDRSTLIRFYKYVRIWKWSLITIVTGFSGLFFILEIPLEFMWGMFILLVFGWFSYKKTQKQLQQYELDLEENIKIKTTGTVVKFVFQEPNQYIIFRREGADENQLFYLSYKNDKQLSNVRAGALVELEYTPNCRYILRIKCLA